MTFNEARKKHKQDLKRSKAIDKANEKKEKEREKVKRKICCKIHCLECPFCRTDKCREFIKNGDFSHLWNWYKGVVENT